MKIKKKKTRRSDIKIMTKEAAVLKHLRESRKLSLRRAATAIGLSEAKLNHSENGRCDLGPTLILKIVVGYGYDYSYFMELVKGNKEMPSNTFKECVEILKRLDKQKLKTVKAILECF